MMEKLQNTTDSSYGKRDWKKWILIYVVIAAILCGGVYLVLSKTGNSDNTENRTNTCQTDNDCLPGEYCTQAGPIVLDPSTKKPLIQKTCQKNGTAAPF